MYVSCGMNLRQIEKSSMISITALIVADRWRSMTDITVDDIKLVLRGKENIPLSIC